MNKRTQISIAAALLSFSAAAIAQTGPVRPQYEFPSMPQGGRGAGAVRMGETPFYFAPYIGTAVGQDDNLYLSSSSQKRSGIWLVNPGFRIDARDASKVFQVGYLGAIGRYSSASSDNYVDHNVRASFDAMAGRESAFRAAYDYVRGHDARGSTDRPSGSSPDKYETQGAGLVFAYGQKGATGRVEAFFSDARKRYQNNRSSTAGSDRDTKDGGVAGYFRVGPRTQIVAEYRKSDFDYVSASGLSSEEERLYGGVTWEATAATSGTVKVGRLKKEFASNVPSFSGTGWEAMITWTPRTYSKFDLYSSRQPSESTGQGTFILSEASGMVWSHSWTAVWTTEANLRFQKDKYQGIARSDDVTGIGLKAGYKFRRWLSFGAEYQYTNRDSTSPISEYDRNFWLLTATATM